MVTDASGPGAGAGPRRLPFGLLDSPRLHRPALRSLGLGYLIVLVVLPTAALGYSSLADGPGAFWRHVTRPEALAALRLTFGMALLAALLSAVLGTVAAFAITRLRIPGRALLEALVDLPIAIPTAVGGLMIFAFWGPHGPARGPLDALGIEVLYAKPAILLALLFVCFPFTIRAVQPLVEGIDLAQEEAAATLGASRPQTMRWIVWPSIAPGVAAGSMLSFARALGEFGTVAIVAGNLPMKTQMASVYVYAEVESGRPRSAAAVSLVLVAASVILILASDRYVRRAGGGRRRAAGGGR